MSENLISFYELANTLSMVFLIGLVILGGISLIAAALNYYFNNKKQSFKEKEKQEEEKYWMKRRELDTPLMSESRELTEQREELEEKHKAESKEIKEKVNKYEERNNTVNLLFDPIKYGLIAMLILIFTFTLFVSANIDGEFSAIRKIDNDGAGIQANAYYVVDYDYIEQDTLTVFVKNNTNQILDQAVVEEVNTGKTAMVESIEPGQEKIVTIEVYPRTDEDYKFQVKDIQFEE